MGAVLSAVLSSQNVAVQGLSTITSPTLPVATHLHDLGPAVRDFFGDAVHSVRAARVFQAPVRQDGVTLFIATDGEFRRDRPGNGGIRLLDYSSDADAVADAVRLAEGMTRKHDMFRTGFSGAKLVANTDIPLGDIKRKSLMQDIATALEVLSGSVYTGCDLNTCDLDMDYLTEATDEKYVLAGRESRVDTNVATAASVIGSILGLLEATADATLSELTFTIQGCGKVGRTVATELVRLGAKRVQTCDLRASAAQIDGCAPITDWTATPCDFLVPCANSLAITEDVASNFPVGLRFCTGATNQPFASPRAQEIFARRGVFHVPESISSAGAILADSVEWHDVNLYRTVQPALLYGWIRSLSSRKAATMVELAAHDAARMSAQDVVPPKEGDPIGKAFPAWIEEHAVKKVLI